MTEVTDFDGVLQRELSAHFVRAVSGIFECMGRALICLDVEFRVVHVSDGLDAIAGPGASRVAEDLHAEQVLGEDLFGPQGVLRRALLAGERREGWGATLTLPGRAPVLLSVSAASVASMLSPLCDPRVVYMVVVRPISTAPPTEEPPVRFFSGMIGRAPVMLRTFEFIRSLAESEATVLVTGESGTGKELVARALHLDSPRRAGPFVAVNCGALPGELLESELFGHVRGAFTGAVRDRQGRFELARGGTLFLDEVGDLSLALQVKLLRVLQERTFERVGESRSTATDARIIAATNRDLPRDIREGRFREDLYYRLRVVPITMPPLRERREDIEPLALHLLGRVSGRLGRSMLMSPDARRALLEYHWPGNVRELENAIEYAVAVCRGQTIHDTDLPVEVREVRLTGSAAPAPPAFARTDDEVERDQLHRTLEQHRWNRAAAATALGISRTTLWRRMRELGLDR
ncbi:MAG: sigma 54-interacting transcriptional regulator [Candidatus Eisenbacteria bacterium]|jgi:transcriptional regulator with PAS, ATPase and Fis domain|nr:sigma 54-interacting transcriptional regulator [Candidatus Eisenbacteria bacterium]